MRREGKGKEERRETVPFVFNGCKCGFYCGARKLYTRMPHLIIVIDDFCYYDYLLTISLAELTSPSTPGWLIVEIACALSAYQRPLFDMTFRILYLPHLPCGFLRNANAMVTHRDRAAASYN